MAGPLPNPDSGSDERIGIPRWVKVLALVAVVAILLVVVVMVLGGGGGHEGGPGRHTQPAETGQLPMSALAYEVSPVEV